MSYLRTMSPQLCAACGLGEDEASLGAVTGQAAGIDESIADEASLGAVVGRAAGRDESLRQAFQIDT